MVALEAPRARLEPSTQRFTLAQPFQPSVLLLPPRTHPLNSRHAFHAGAR